MSFGNQTPEGSDDNQPQPAQRRKFPWLRGGILCIILGLVNVIYYSQTGKILLGPQSRGPASPTFDLTMSILVFVFGIIAIGIHMYREME